MLLKPFRAGDYIKAQGVEGTLGSIQLFFTMITSPDNKTIFVPGSKLSNELITNFSLADKRRLNIELKFAFTVDCHSLQQVIDRLLKEEQQRIATPDPFMGFSLPEPDGYRVNIKIWLSAKAFAESRSYIMEKLLETLKQQQMLAAAA